MKVLVIGYGSMGKRRIRLLKKLTDDSEIFVVDSNPERIAQAKLEGISTFDNIKNGIEEKPDIAFVCTSPGQHSKIIMELLNHKIHVFTELNLISENYDEIIKLANKQQTVVFMSSTMLYNKIICKIHEIVDTAKKPLTYIYHVGQYLPDWHPWESYKNFFIGKKATNGVREILAIQLPWIIDTFGKMNDLTAKSQKCTSLDIDFCDSIIINMKHQNGNIGVFVADVVSRKATTYLEIIGEDLHLFWNGHNDDLRIYNISKKEMINISAYDNIKHEDGYADNIIENQYLDEIKDFLNAVLYKTVPKYSLEKDKYTLSIIEKVEEIKK